MPIADRDPASDFHLIPADSPEAIFDKLIQVVTERIPARYGFHPIDDIQVLTPVPSRYDFGRVIRPI
jgi:exodeoxyribonuclease V alpha subunit